MKTWRIGGGLLILAMVLIGILTNWRPGAIAGIFIIGLPVYLWVIVANVRSSRRTGSSLDSGGDISWSWFTTSADRQSDINSSHNSFDSSSDGGRHH